MRNLRARNPYALFLKDNYSEISAKYPGKQSFHNSISNKNIIVDLKLVDISKKVAEVWKSLPEEKKQVGKEKKLNDDLIVRFFFCFEDLCEKISRSKGKL
jgi:hypothetical protein